jgi:DNA-binding NarL/FixJ family response regulator
MIHVILSLSSAFVREAVRQELEDNDDIRVVAEVSSPVELLRSTEIEQADAVILESDDGLKTPGVLSHLFGEFPQIVAVVVGRQGDRAVVYRQRLCEQVFKGVSLANLLKELRTADTEYWAREKG